MHLNTHLRDELLLGRDLREPARFVKRLRERFLAVHVQTAIHRPHRDRRVHVIRSRDVHRVQVLFLVEQHAVIAVDFALGKLLLHARDAAFVHLGHGHQLEVLAPGKRVDVGAGHAGSSKTRVQNGLAWRRVRVQSPDERRGERGGNGFQCSATCDSWHERGLQEGGMAG